MAEQEVMQVVKGRRKKRKTSPRPTKTGKTCPAKSAAGKARWADPAFREKMLLARKDSASKRAANGTVHTGRLGVPDGMRKERADKLRERAERKAEETMKALKASGVVDEGADPRGVEALEAALVVMRAPGDKREKLAAARLILDFTRAKPASKSEITVNKAEQWLAAVAEDMDDEDQSGTGEDETEATD